MYCILSEQLVESPIQSDVAGPNWLNGQAWALLLQLMLGWVKLQFIFLKSCQA